MLAKRVRALLACYLYCLEFAAAAAAAAEERPFISGILTAVSSFWLSPYLFSSHSK